MMLVPVHVKASDIHGVGIFASQHIPAGTLIWETNETLDLMIPESKLAELPEAARRVIDIHGYPSVTNPGFYVLECDNGRFMNHSETPNTDFTTHVQGFALRDIEKDEELTSNYAEFMPAFDGYTSQAA